MSLPIILLILTIICIICIIIADHYDSELVILPVVLTIGLGVGTVFASLGCTTKTVETEHKVDDYAVNKGIAVVRIEDDTRTYTDYNTITSLNDSTVFVKTEQFNIFGMLTHREFHIKK